MQLKYLSIPVLIAEAGGDPWQRNAQVQSGEPDQISELAQAFYGAGVSMKETSDEFRRAQGRFERSWDREAGMHPINDSAEVQHATDGLKLSKEELTRVGVDLQNIAAALAEAQSTCAEVIAALENNLQAIDDAIDRTVQQTGLPVAELEVDPIVDMAVQDTKDALRGVTNARDTYAGQLSRSLIEMEAEGYDPSAIDASDGDGQSEATAAETEAGEYGFAQRAADQALVDSPGPMTPQKDAAADRLRDFATINNSSSDPRAVELAAQRLDDHQQAMMPTPGPRDSVLGVDSRSRAQSRLRMQKLLEEGVPGQAPMAPDEATAWMNQEESRLKTRILEETERVLAQNGMAGDDADAILSAMASGWTLDDLVAYADVSGTAAADLEDRLSVGRHATDRFDADTVKAISQLGRYVKGAGTGLDIWLTIDALNNGAPPGETIGEIAGSTAGSALLAPLGGFAGGWLLGPGGAFVGLVSGVLIGDSVGGWGGREAGKLFDY